MEERRTLKFTELLLLNLIWLMSSLPIITIGASTTALYYVLMKAARGEKVDVNSDFFKSFTLNFRQSTILWIIF
ncbi:MAG: YesL family protein, partial [Eubacterium sp.]